MEVEANPADQTAIADVAERKRGLMPADYETIRAAVVETTRGRWFLEEFARRNRQADTQAILDALRELRNSRAEQVAVPPFGMGAAPECLRGPSLPANAEPLLAQGREALIAILAAAEQIQEAGWRLKAKGSDVESCSQIEAQVRAIYAAAPLQELALIGLAQSAAPATS